MPRIPLLGGAYQSRSLVAGAQRCVNLYPENNPPEGSPPVPITHYPTPGLKLLGQSPNIGMVRASYRATNGDLYCVVGPDVYYVNTLWQFTALGVIADAGTPVSLSDNGTVIVLVDGTPNGYCIDMASRNFAAINDPDFFGGTRVDYLDTFFILNKPGTNQWYISLANVTQAMLTGGSAFDPLDIAAKVGGADNLQTLIVVHGEIWLIGILTSEVWVNTGAADFTFGRLPGTFIEHGTAAPYSVAKIDKSVFWLSLDAQGQGVIVQSEPSYDVKRVSTYSIDAAIQAYSKITDGIGFTHQQQGHAFYVLSFPTADHTWGYEIGNGQWHERVSIDNNGLFHRNRANCFANAYGVNVVGDYQSGALYNLDPNTFDDNGMAIPRVRTFPHLVSDGKVQSYKYFRADIEVGQTPGFPLAVPPLASLRWSFNRGATFGNAVEMPMGATADFYASPLWAPIGGPTRDCVFELSWSTSVKTALNGAWTEYESADM